MMNEVTYTISGMSCEHCVKAVENALKEIDGVTVRNVEIGRAVVAYDDDQVKGAEVVAALEEEGYTVEE